MSREDNLDAFLDIEGYTAEIFGNFRRAFFRKGKDVPSWEKASRKGTGVALVNFIELRGNLIIFVYVVLRSVVEVF